MIIIVNLTSITIRYSNYPHIFIFFSFNEIFSKLFYYVNSNNPSWTNKKLNRLIPLKDCDIGNISKSFVNVNAQGEGGANQTIQQEQENPQNSANRTMEKAFQSANETGEDVKKFGSQVKEGAKDVIGSIGEKLQDLGK